MNIVMLTNTYLPHVGGVARSVSSFTEELRRLRHRVLVIAPSFEGQPSDESDVLRVPAIQNFNGSDFSVRLPLPIELSPRIEAFEPDLVHSHHSFLMGDTALRVAALFNIPVVFTHHTMYERYTHYVPGDSPALRRYVVDLTTSYANLCATVIAPSESIKEVLIHRGILSKIDVIPTGVDTTSFGKGDGAAFRRSLRIPPRNFVVGHVGRLAEEKNLGFLSRAVIRFLKAEQNVHFLVVGGGSYEEEMKKLFDEAGLTPRVHFAGSRQGQELIDAYHAMDVFVFASQTETQGMVIAESMAAGVPVIAVDAPGVREVITHGENSFLLPNENEDEFFDALCWYRHRRSDLRGKISRAAKRRAREFSIGKCTKRLVRTYAHVIRADRMRRAEEEGEETPWHAAMRFIERELLLWSNRAHAVGVAVASSGEPVE